MSADDIYRQIWFWHEKQTSQPRAGSQPDPSGYRVPPVFRAPCDMVTRPRPGDYRPEPAFRFAPGGLSYELVDEARTIDSLTGTASVLKISYRELTTSRWLRRPVEGPAQTATWDRSKIGQVIFFPDPSMVKIVHGPTKVGVRLQLEDPRLVEPLARVLALLYDAELI